MYHALAQSQVDTNHSKMVLTQAAGAVEYTDPP